MYVYRPNFVLSTNFPNVVNVNQAESVVKIYFLVMDKLVPFFSKVPGMCSTAKLFFVNRGSIMGLTATCM